MADTPSTDARPWFASWFDDPVEVVSAITLSLAGLVTSWSGYQAALWDGEQAAHYSQASAIRIASARASGQAGQREQADIQLFSEWLDAYASGHPKLEAFYRSRFRGEFKPAFEAWLKTKVASEDAPAGTPFTLPAYRSAAREEAQTLERKADETFEAGQKAREISDAFVQGAVLLASAMFFGGICQAFRVPRVRLLLVSISVITCALGLIKVLSLPIH